MAGGGLRLAAGCEPRQLGAPSERRRLFELQTDLIKHLEDRGASAVVIHYVLTDLLAHNLARAQIGQRIRRAKERSARHAWQKAQKPELLQRCICSFEAECAYCERIGSADADPDGKKWELDRIWPGAYGGEYDPLNVALACHACNQKKGQSITLVPPPSLAERIEPSAETGGEGASGTRLCNVRTHCVRGTTT